MTRYSQDDSTINSRFVATSPNDYADERLKRFLARFDYKSEGQEKNRLQDWYVARDEKLASDKRLDKWYDAEEIEHKKLSEEQRVKKAQEDFENNFKKRLHNLYARQYEQAQSKFARQPLRHFEDEIDQKLADALRVRSEAIESERNELDFIHKVTNEMQGRSTISMVDKAQSLYRGEAANKASRVPYHNLDYPNLPREDELKWYNQKKDDYANKKNICQRNLNNLLDVGQEVDDFRSKVVDKNGDLKKPPVFSNFGPSSIAQAGSYLAKNFAKHVGNVFQSPEDRERDSIDGHELKDWSPYRRNRELGFDKVKHFVDKINAIDESQLSGRLEQMISSLKAEKDSLGPQDAIRIQYLEDLIEKLQKNLEATKKALETFKDGFDKAVEEQNEKMQREMQKNYNSQMDKLKWHLLCAFLMASPFAQGLMVAGPLFEYLDFLGDILGPVFMHPDGFASGFAQALENFPVLGDLMRLTRISDGFELLFNETPILSGITGNDGLITGFTRNGIFQGVANSINYNYLYLPVAGAAAFYLFQDVANDSFGDKTGNTNPSVKMIRDDYLEALDDIIKSKNIDLERMVGGHHDDKQYEIGRAIFPQSKQYFKNSAIANSFQDLLQNSLKTSNLDKILEAFDGIKIFGEADNKKDIYEHINEELKSGKSLEHIFADGNFMQPLNKAIIGNGDMSENNFGKKVTILTNNYLTNPATAEEILQDVALSGADLDNAYKKAGYSHIIRFYKHQHQSLLGQGGSNVAGMQSLLDMEHYNEEQDFEKVAKLDMNLEEYLANEITTKNIEAGRDYRTMLLPAKSVEPAEAFTLCGKNLLGPDPKVSSNALSA